jgi:hypothetical protein
MANLLSDKERKREENKRLWALRTKEAQPKANTRPSREARIKEFRDLLLDGPTGKKILEKVLDVALDDGHQGQMAALKMCVDRILPQSYFENQKDAQRTAIQINIRGLGDSSPVEVVDV